jgi:cell cycle checkpoint control protein RAD9A
MDHFGPGIELLDINTDGENVVNFTCFTEKAVNPSTDGTFPHSLLSGWTNLTQSQPY